MFDPQDTYGLYLPDQIYGRTNMSEVTENDYIEVTYAKKTIYTTFSTF